MRHLLSLVLATVAFPSVASAIPANEPLKIVNTLDDFERAWKATEALPDNQRIGAFRTQFEAILPGFYDPKRVADFVSSDRYSEMILKGLKDYPAKRAEIQKVGQLFEGMAIPARQQFEATFGPMTGYPPIYIVDSFGEFDGGTRDLSDGSHLMFGADVIATIYKGIPIKPFVQHELFHLLHARSFGDCAPIYCNLWSEGLATYVAATLNPGADDAAIGLTLPEPIRPMVDPRFGEAVCAVKARLDSEKPEDYAPLFYGSKRLPGFPPRMGYYIGYRVAQDIGRTRDLKRLAALKPAEVRPLIDASLDGMASCDDKSPPVERG